MSYTAIDQDSQVAKAERAYQIQCFTQELEYASSNILDNISALEDRLACCLTGPLPSEVTEKDLEEQLVPHAANLREILKQVQKANARIIDLRKRCEL